MSLQKYFRVEQKILLRPLVDPPEDDRIETLSAFVLSCENTWCDLTFPYQSPPGEEFPFAPGTRLEILGEAMGLGIRAVGQFDRRLDDDAIRLRLEPDLEIFQRRQHRRHDLQAGIRFTRGMGALRSFREQWQKNIRLLGLPANQDKLNRLPTATINLSAGGIRLLLKPAVTPGEVFMVFVKMMPDTPAFCVLAEVVWNGEPREDGRLPTGMRFISILKQDSLAIEQYINRLGNSSVPET